MPVHKAMPRVTIQVHATHEQWDGEQQPSSHTPAALTLQMAEHTGTHVDALSHMGKPYAAQSIDTMPLSTFYTEAICLDFSHKQLMQLIEPNEIEQACFTQKLVIKQGDTVLFYTDHYRKTFGTTLWNQGPGLSAEAARWLGQHKVNAFGVETHTPGVAGVSNKDVHRVCGEMGFTHYENLVNLHQLIDIGRFQFIGFPLKIRGGTGSPVRAVAVIQ